MYTGQENQQQISIQHENIVQSAVARITFYSDLFSNV